MVTYSFSPALYPYEVVDGLLSRPVHLYETVSIASCILANVGALSTDCVGAWIKQKVKPIDCSAPFLLVWIACAPNQDSVVESLAVHRKRVPN